MIVSSLAVVLGLALPASALSVNASDNASTGVSVSGVSVGVSGSASTSAGAHGNGSGQKSTGLGADVSNVVQQVIGSTTAIGVHASGGGSAVAQAVLPIVMTRADVASRGTASAGVTGNATSSAAVDTESSLQSYIAATMQADPNVDEVQASSDSVAVLYKVPAKFLGFIPVSVSATTMVGSDGSVTIRYPWWAFLFATDDQLKTQIESRVDAALQSDANFSATSSAQADVNAFVNPSVRARVIGEVEAALRSSVGLSADASSSAAIQ